MPTVSNPTIQEIDLKKDGIYLIEMLYCTSNCDRPDSGFAPLYLPRPKKYRFYYENTLNESDGKILTAKQQYPICPYFAPADVKKVLCLVSKKNKKLKIIKFPKMARIISNDKIMILGFNRGIYRLFVDFADFDSLKTKQHTLKGEDVDIVFNPIFLKENKLFVYLAKNIKRIKISGINDDYHSRYGWYHSYEGWATATYDIDGILMQICIYKL